MKVTRRCREARVKMTTHDLLAGRTIRGLAARILSRSKPTTSNSSGGVDVKVPAKPNHSVLNALSLSEQDVEDVVPATPFQQQMYGASRTHPGRPYCASFLARLTTKGPDAQVDVQKLSQAWQRAVDRHPILRTLFVINPHDDTLYQAVLRKAQPHIEIRHVEDEAAAAGQLSQDHDVFSQQLTSGAADAKSVPSHRFILSQTRSGDVLLTLSLSHLVTDTVAVEHMFSELDTFYSGASPSQPAVPFAAYANWFEPRVVAANNKAWHEQVLRGVQPCFLPGPPGRSPRAEEVLLPFSIPSSQRQTISDFCHRAQVTTSYLFQFCWAMVLKRYTQQDVVSFGQVVASRDAPVANLEDVVGPVLSVLPACADLASPTRSVLDLMQSFQKTNIDALAHQPCSLRAIEKLVGCPADRGLFNTMINIRMVHYQGKSLKYHLEQRDLGFKPIVKRDGSEVSSHQPFSHNACWGT